MNRRPLVVGNWKMNGTLSMSAELTREIHTQLANGPAAGASIDIVIAPPFTALARVAEILGSQRSAIELGAQNMHAADSGSHTGEISPPMLTELGVRWVILGHSERRADDGETDAKIARKVKAALAHGLIPIIAVGETQQQHDAGNTHDVVTRQTRAALDGLDDTAIEGCVVAYEPIWAIGQGIPDHPERVNATMAAIRGCVAALADARLLYGGSVRHENAPGLFAQPHVDGGLIGGASLDAGEFVAIVHAADEAGKVF